MINIWDYEYTNNKIRLITKNGKTVEGYVANVSDFSEYEDVYENPEDMIDIENENGIFGFKQSEILKIELLPKIDFITVTEKPIKYK
ncbi:MAG: hypothetical protein LBM93_11360 [Oscillospiraceae bacterium]|jgi:hypothetical protein|nr:hypothetical protein [Oscillospiraceae bacterium]